jgi:hypothetical protein
MAGHRGYTKTAKTGGVRPRDVYFRFFPSGNSTTALTTAAGTLMDPGGAISNVTQSADGVFTCTLNDPAYRIIFCAPEVQLSAATVDLEAQTGDITLPTNGSGASVVVRLHTGATNTTMASNTNNSVMVHLHIEDSAAAGVA